MSFPVSSSSNASSWAMCSSQSPAGGRHCSTRAVRGASSSKGCPFFFAFFPFVVGVLDPGRPRFLPRRAVAVSSNNFSRPPSFAKYSSRTEEAFSLRGQCVSGEIRPVWGFEGLGSRTVSSPRAPTSCLTSFRSPPTLRGRAVLPKCARKRLDEAGTGSSAIREAPTLSLIIWLAIFSTTYLKPG